MPIRITDAVQAAAPQGAKRLFVKSYGCQMNVYDGIRLADLMAPQGYALVEEPAEADLIVLNTCHIREKADDKLFSDLGRFKRAAPQAILAVGGCTGQALGAKIFQQQPAVKIVFGPQTIQRLPALLEKALQGQRAIDTDFPELEKFDALPTPGAYGASAFVTIQEGCDKFCTYCVVPYTRGAEISRPATDILAEVQALAVQGVKEITLLGQNVNAYEHAGVGLAELCRLVGEVPGIARVRFTTSHPNNTTPELIAAFAPAEQGGIPKLMPYFHLPVQAGSDTVLARMNRNHTVASYLETIAAVRAVRPDVAISGDFIVGFPGETEEEFQQTLAVAAHVGYVGAYSFAYSPRPGTPAAELPDQLDEMTKKARLAALQAVLDAGTAAFCQRFVGQTLEVLVEGPAKEDTNGLKQLRGRSPHNLSVNFTYGDANPVALVGQLAQVRVERATVRSLVGVLAE
jgi:tRNA-2-methylthio-N6-dimethylallyladenosine synthase